MLKREIKALSKVVQVEYQKVDFILNNAVMFDDDPLEETGLYWATNFGAEKELSLKKTLEESKNLIALREHSYATTFSGSLLEIAEKMILLAYGKVKEGPSGKNDWYSKFKPYNKLFQSSISTFQ